MRYRIATLILVAAALCGVRATNSAPRAAAARSLNDHPGLVLGTTQLASEAGAALNSNLLSGGGTDDTLVLQRLLDVAADGRPLRLIVDGPALIAGLNVHGNTTIECTAGGGFYLKDNSSRAIIRNAQRSRGIITDENIQIRGCFLNGNRAHQPGTAHSGLGKEADGTWITGLQFFGVRNLVIEDVTLWNIRAFGVFVGNASRVEIRGVVVDHGASPDVDISYGNTDGLNFKGPLQYVTIDNVKLRTGDDAIAFNADDWGTDDITVNNEDGPYVGNGPITDVSVSNVILMDAVQAIRILSSKQRIDRIVITNVTGTLRGNWLANISHYVNPSLGNIGSITLSNISVDRTLPMARISSYWVERLRGKEGEGGLWGKLYEDFNGGASALIQVNAHVEQLSIRNLSTKIQDDRRPVVRVGQDAKVHMMTAELSIYDPDLKGVPLEVAGGGRVERLNLFIDWKGQWIDQGRTPIVADAEAIGQLNWIDTPPMYVNAKVTEPDIVSVTLSQIVKGTDMISGVEVRVNGETAPILDAAQIGTGDEIRYRIRAHVKQGDLVTWSYDAARGFIENMSGGNLVSVAPKKVQ